MCLIIKKNFNSLENGNNTKFINKWFYYNFQIKTIKKFIFIEFF